MPVGLLNRDSVKAVSQGMDPKEKWGLVRKFSSKSHGSRNTGKAGWSRAVHCTSESPVHKIARLHPHVFSFSRSEFPEFAFLTNSQRH